MHLEVAFAKIWGVALTQGVRGGREREASRHLLGVAVGKSKKGEKTKIKDKRLSRDDNELPKAAGGKKMAQTSIFFTKSELL